MDGVYGISSAVVCFDCDLSSFNFVLAPTVGAMYTGLVRVIARSTLNGFVCNHVEYRLRKAVQSQLDAWYALVTRAAWNSSADLKRFHPSASILSADRVVFNIKGNVFRLVERVDYRFGVVLILWLGTHGEYNRIDVRNVQFDKERYADS